MSSGRHRRRRPVNRCGRTLSGNAENGGSFTRNKDSNIPLPPCISEKQRADPLSDLRLVYSAAEGTSAKKEAINSLGDKVGPGLKFGVDNRHSENAS